MSLLEIENLSLTIGATPILKEMELSIASAEVMGLVGESGPGKSMTAPALIRPLPHSARATAPVPFMAPVDLPPPHPRVAGMRRRSRGRRI